MEFAFSPDQEDLRASVRSFLAHETPMAVVRAHLETDTDAPESVWQAMVALGWPGLLVPEQFGGLGLGPVDLVAVCEELGRALYGGPFLASAVLATTAAERLGLHDELRSLAAGDATATVAIEEAGYGDPVERIRVRASGRGERYRLDGTKTLVIDGHRADWMLVAARTREGLQTFLVDTTDAVFTPTLDLTRKFASVTFDDTPARLVGPPGDQRAIWHDIVDLGALALAAELVGMSEAANALALDYAQSREAFGKPVSKFQVTRHKAVDLLREVELSRVGVHYAAWALEIGAPDARAAVAMAKAHAGEAANHCGAECIQIHGGMGYTWECDAHLYLRRAKVNDLLFGHQAWQRERVADAYFAGL
mgnify:CR=1 FL=1